MSSLFILQEYRSSTLRFWLLISTHKKKTLAQENKNRHPGMAINKYGKENALKRSLGGPYNVLSALCRLILSYAALSRIYMHRCLYRSHAVVHSCVKSTIVSSHPTRQLLQNYSHREIFRILFRRLSHNQQFPFSDYLELVSASTQRVHSGAHSSNRCIFCYGNGNADMSYNALGGNHMIDTTEQRYCGPSYVFSALRYRRTRHKKRK